MSPDTRAPPRCARHAGVGESGQRTAISQCLGPGTQASLSCRSSAVPMPHGKCVTLKDLRSDRVRPTGGGGLVVRVKQLENELHYFRKVGGKDSPRPRPSPATAPKNSSHRASPSHLGALGDLEVGDVGQGGVEAGGPGAEGAGVRGRHVAVRGVGLVRRGQSHDLLTARGNVRRSGVSVNCSCPPPPPPGACRPPPELGAGRGVSGTHTSVTLS